MLWPSSGAGRHNLICSTMAEAFEIYLYWLLLSWEMILWFTFFCAAFYLLVDFLGPDQYHE